MKFKNTILVLCLIGWSTASIAQEAAKERPLTKDGKEILPEKGDIAIGIQAESILEFAGNFFGKSNSNNSPSFTALNNTIYLKKFIDNNTAIRATLQLRRDGNTNVYGYVSDDQAVNDPLNTQQVTDAVQSTNYQNNIGLGLEKRRGYGRLQGFYGAGASVGFSGGKTSYAYGNAMSASNPRPTSYNGSRTTRTLEQNFGSFGIGANGFIGVEYFVARKISLQGEIGWGLSYNWNKANEGLYETVQNGERVEYSRTIGTENRSFDYNNRASSAIGIMFHF